jgi:outer membrane protein OmpA-like peptidoglycan-associated protein
LEFHALELDSHHIVRITQVLSTNSIRKVSGLVALLFTLAATPAAAQLVQDPPPELSFLSTILKVRKNIPYQSWDEVKFPKGDGPYKQGKHWFVLAETANGTDPLTEWKKIKPAFLQNGWTLFKESLGGGMLEVLQYKRDGVEAWANVDTDGSPLIFRLDVIEIAPLPFTLTLAAPAATPEKIATDKGDFPYLAPLPGSKFHRGGWDNTPFRVQPAGAQQLEMVANGILYRDYDFPEISNALLTASYRNGLTQGGWTIVQSGSSTITAHYTQSGRNIWAMVSPNGPGGYTISVADAGAVDLEANLTKACHVAIYGVLFDFDKSTLQPASDAALQPVANIMAADKTLKLEVQGHTDNVGADAYNQTLSEARAKAVVTWLTQHGVSVDRLTAKGYGKSKPVADNGNDEGRAKNRRVEIADPTCSPKGN